MADYSKANRRIAYTRGRGRAYCLTFFSVEIQRHAYMVAVSSLFLQVSTMSLVVYRDVYAQI